MNRFPQALYIAGGAELIEGRNYTSKLVADEAELDASLADGWHPTTAAAAAAAAADQASAERIAAQLAEQDKKPGDDGHDDDDDAKPTRAELEQKATELGVEFSPKLGDKKLAERIAAKLAEQGS